MMDNYFDENMVWANQQNAHMLQSQINANKAVHELIRMGLTVIDVYLGLVQPVITVQPTKETGKLSKVVVKNTRRNGTHCAIYSAQLSDCKVEWESCYVH